MFARLEEFLIQCSFCRSTRKNQSVKYLLLLGKKEKKAKELKKLIKEFTNSIYRKNTKNDNITENTIVSRVSMKINNESAENTKNIEYYQKWTRFLTMLRTR